MAATLRCVEDAFRLYDGGEVIEPQAPLIHWGNMAGRRISMHPAFVGGDVQVAGIKWIPSNPANPEHLRQPRSNALTILSDPESGYPLAVMEGKLISDMRTGAVCGIGARHLARSGSHTLALIGAGPISRTQLMALHAVFGVPDGIFVYDRVPGRAETFIRDMTERLNIPSGGVMVAPSAEAAVRAADVIATATNVDLVHRYLREAWVQTGALVINTSVNDVDFDLVTAVDRVVVDSVKQFELEGTVLSEARRRGLLEESRLTEVGAILTGRLPGRTHPRDRILFSPLGMGMHDLINAKRVYDEARRRDVGTWLRLWDAPEWY